MIIHPFAVLSSVVPFPLNNYKKRFIVLYQYYKFNYKNMAKAKVTKDMNIREVLQDYPQVLEVFLDHEIGCIGCQAADFESIEEGVAMHGIDADKFVQLLNDHIEFVKSEK